MSGFLTLDGIDVHAEGEPGRIITSAAHLVQGDTMVERLAYCREHLDWLRQLVLQEPRGYPALCAVLILPPVHEGSDFGIAVLEQGGFTPMSGSNTICAVTAVLEEGIVTPRRRTDGTAEVVIDTAVGTVRATAQVDDGGKVTSVTVANVASYTVALDYPLDVSGFGTVRADVVFGGQFFVQVPASELGLTLDPANGRELARAGALVKLAAAEQVDAGPLDVVHPDNHDVAGINLVMLHSGNRVPGWDSQNVVVLTQKSLDPADPVTWTGILDRSPCGTGTSARMAALHARGELAIGEDFHHRSIIGTKFVGQLTGTTTVGGREAVLPTLTGRAWVTGHAQWRLDPSDPFPLGYTVGDIWPPNPRGGSPIVG